VIGRRSLRQRLTASFAVGAAALSLLFGGITFLSVRAVLVGDREQAEQQQAYVNAALVRNAALSGGPSIPTLLRSLNSATASTSYLRQSGRWIQVAGQRPDTFATAAFLHILERRQVVSQERTLHGTPYFVVGVPLPSIHSEYLVVRSLRDLNRSLATILGIFGAVTVFTTLSGTVVGRRLTVRTVAPLKKAADTAELLAHGDYSARLTEDGDSEVAALAASFNAMVEQLTQRIARDARFASDVSHELRSPLTTLSTSVAVLQRSRDALSPDAQRVLDVLTADVGTFRTLVEDLLEMASSDAGQGAMFAETLPIAELLDRSIESANHRLGLLDVDRIVDDDVAGVLVRVDRRRFERVISNLLDNADRYGGGATAVHLFRDANQICITVDDAGPGVAIDDRTKVFERFYRGAASGARGEVKGSGLGLSIVADHIHHFGGTVQVGDSPAGGCRVQLTLPIQFGESA
jgi:two-component system, OmpR family, sensor histidine kinase MtrB